jgi:AcrR family transcriptional regulator
MNKEKILNATRVIFAKNGYEGLSMRILANEIGMTLSVLYHYYPSKDEILHDLFKACSLSLGDARRSAPVAPSAMEMLRGQIRFQFAHAEEVVFLLKYYLHFRDRFPHVDNGYLPEKSDQHMREIVLRGLGSGEFESPNPAHDSRVMTHAVNGYVLEHYPSQPTKQELEELVEEIALFVSRALVPTTRLTKSL